MRFARNWIGWIAVVVVVIWANSVTAAQESPSQRRSAERIPLDKLPPDVRERVRLIIERPTLFGHGPAEAFAGDPQLYYWLLDHPDRAVLAWRRLGAKCTDIQDKGSTSFCWTDNHGSKVEWRTVYSNPTTHVWYAEGKVRPGVLLPPVPLSAVLVLRHGDRSTSNDRTLIFHQADLFLQTDSKTAALVTRMLGASAPRVAEQGLNQLELFFSALVWYLDQHPERRQKLLLDEHRPELPATCPK